MFYPVIRRQGNERARLYHQTSHTTTKEQAIWSKVVTATSTVHDPVEIPDKIQTRLSVLLYLLLKYIYIYIYLTANGLTPGGSSTATFTRKQYTEYKERNIHSNHKM